MRLAANLLLVAGLILGVIGAVTAYLPPLSLPDDHLIGLTLNSPAGSRTDETGKVVPIAPKDAVLDTVMISDLRSSRTSRVRVKEFSLDRWPEWWMFVAGCAGLTVGALINRREARRALALAGAEQSGRGAGPEASLATIIAEVERLRRDLPTIAGARERERAILDRIGHLQQTAIADFVSARTILLGRLGMAGFARLMDSFAAAERQINRAWSAAADEVEAESAASLARAADLLAEAQRRLAAR
jgi:hypothetical protein